MRERANVAARETAAATATAVAAAARTWRGCASESKRSRGCSLDASVAEYPCSTFSHPSAASPLGAAQQAVEVERLAAGAQAATFAPPDSPWC